MRLLATPPSMAERAYQEILSEIISGRLRDHSRLIQDDIARDLGVSRQPVQQALALLRSQGFVRDAPGRGLEVSPIDIEFVRDLYEIRAVTEGLACSLAAERGAKEAAKSGPKLIEAGRRAESEHSVGKLIEADVHFHEFLYRISGNRLIPVTTQPYWLHLRRIMGEVLRSDESPWRIWDQHEEILQAIIRGDGKSARELVRDHITNTGSEFIARLAQRRDGAQWREVLPAI